MPRLLAAFPAVAGLQQIVDRIGGGVDVYSALCRHQTEPMTAPESNRVRAFDAAPHALDGALLEPVLRFLQMGQRAGVRLAGIRPSLKPAQTVAQHRKQRLMGDAIHAVAVCVDRAILEAEVRRHCLAAFDVVGVARTVELRMAFPFHFAD